jgi:ribonuclease HI
VNFLKRFQDKFLSRSFAGFEVYTDGSYKEGRGAWAFVIVQKGVVIQEAASFVKKTSSNRMEFQAAIEALNYLPPQSQVRLYSDSRILIENVTKHSAVWKSLGWKKKNQQEIPNVDLFKNLDELSSQHQISWHWVKAHSGQVHNERCDELCIQARENLKAYAKN